jgi:hypothetical protein
MILLFFIMRCTPIIRELIVATRYRCPLHRLPASRLLLPRSGLERSDFVPWGQSGNHLLVLSFSHFDPMYGPAVRCNVSGL